MRISDWSSDVCSSDLSDTFLLPERLLTLGLVWRWRENKKLDATGDQEAFIKALDEYAAKDKGSRVIRSEEHTSELQSLMRISYAVFCLKKKKQELRSIINQMINPARSPQQMNMSRRSCE